MNKLKTSNPQFMEKNLSKRLKDRLKLYSLAAGAFVAGSETADAAIVYTDINPNFSGVTGSQYFLDLNNDNIDDFRIYHDGGANLFIQPLNSSNEVLGLGSVLSYASGFAYPYALSSGDSIQAAPTSGSWFNNGYSTGYQSLNYGSGSFGNWVSVTDKYLGLRFVVGANTYYGWARLDVNADGSVWSVKDYAYENVAGTSILAGAAGAVATPIPSSPATLVTAADGGNNSNGTDLAISFAAAPEENLLTEYRIMIVDDANTLTFDLAAAQAVTTGNYVAITPTGSSVYNPTLLATTTDVDGNLIVNGQPYSVFVLSVADGVNANTDTLSAPSNSVTLLVPPSAATNLVATDADDLNTGADLDVTFDAAANEAAVGEYRMLAVKTANAGSFDLAAAQAVTAGNYKVVAPSGSTNYNESFAGTNDVDGDAITLGETYTVFVMSLADGTNTITDTLSNASNDVTLNIEVNVVSNLAGADVSNNIDASDLEVRFDAAAEENEISEYRVFVVKQGAAFDQATAESIGAASFFAQTPSGAANYTFTVNAGLKDTDGDDVAQNTPYELYVLSVANGTDANLNALSGASDSVMLKDVLSVGELEAANVRVWNNGNQLTISGLTNKQTAISIYNLNGQLIESFTTADVQITRTLSTVASGMYMVKVSTDSATISKKVLID